MNEEQRSNPRNQVGRVIGGVGAGLPGGGVAFAPGRGFGWGFD